MSMKKIVPNEGADLNLVIWNFSPVVCKRRKIFHRIIGGFDLGWALRWAACFMRSKYWKRRGFILN